MTAGLQSNYIQRFDFIMVSDVPVALEDEV